MNTDKQEQVLLISVYLRSSAAHDVFSRHPWGVWPQVWRPLFRAQQVGEQTIRPRYPRRKLPEPRVRAEDVDALAVVRPDFPAFQRLLAGVLRGEHGLVVRIPLGGKVETAFLHPTLEILGVDVVGVLQERTVMVGERERRLFHCD